MTASKQSKMNVSAIGVRYWSASVNGRSSILKMRTPTVHPTNIDESGHRPNRDPTTTTTRDDIVRSTSAKSTVVATAAVKRTVVVATGIDGCTKTKRNANIERRKRDATRKAVKSTRSTVAHPKKSIVGMTMHPTPLPLYPIMSAKS